VVRLSAAKANFKIPPIPRKKNKGKFENDFIKKRMYFLERFLNACVKNDDLKASRFLMYFLSVEDANAFKNKQKVGFILNTYNPIGSR